MGLDIGAYQKVTRIKDYDGDYDYPREVGVFGNPHFVERMDGLEAGIYQVEGETHDFRAGSYSGYNHWRQQLAELVDTSAEDVWNGQEPPAFGELINFSDCEGIIGPVTSAKLAKDFAEWQARAEEFAAGKGGYEGEYWLQRYNDWRKAFEIAAGEGIVRFH